MDTKKVMLVFGTRPEAIKMAPLVKELKKHEYFKTIVTVTAQHREMLDQVLELFHILPDYDLNLMKRKQGLTQITNRVLEGMAPILEKERPDVVLVHGDTTTTFAAALAAFYQKIPVGHVEAGLRTYHKYAPFPEEINRHLTGVLTEWHFAPTPFCKKNLLLENVKPEKILITGNTVIDAFLDVASRTYKFKDPILQKIDFEQKKIIVVEAHRRENLGQPLINICRALLQLSDNVPNCEIIFPVHRNPLVQETVYQFLGKKDHIHLLEPLEYAEFAALLSKATIIMTDSGGIQEEAPAKGIPVVVLRDVTERQEAVSAGTVCIGGTNIESIYQQALHLLTDQSVYQKMAQAVNPYGNGKAASYIVEGLKHWLGLTDKQSGGWTS